MQRVITHPRWHWHFYHPSINPLYNEPKQLDDKPRLSIWLQPESPSIKWKARAHLVTASHHGCDHFFHTQSLETRIRRVLIMQKSITDHGPENHDASFRIQSWYTSALRFWLLFLNSQRIPICLSLKLVSGQEIKLCR